MFGAISIILTFILAFGAGFITDKILLNPGAKYSLIALAPAIFFATISAVLRGFFAGLKDMRPQGVSQVVEQIFNCFLSIFIVFLLLSQSSEIMVIGSSLGTTLATVAAVISLLLFYKTKAKEIKTELKDALNINSENTKKIIKSILKFSIPISIISIAQALSGIIDLATVMRGLQNFLSYEEANIQLGILTGKVDILASLPLALNVAFAVVLVPAVAGAIAVGDYEDAKRKSTFSLLLSILIVLPCSIGLIVLADPILKLLFPSTSSGALILQFISFSTIFSAISQTLSGTLQGLGKVLVPAKAIIIGAIIKIILNVILVPIPSIGIIGATISTIVFSIVVTFIMYKETKSSLKIKLDIKKFIVKPLIASGIMGVVAIGAYKILFMALNSNAIATIISMGLAALVYGILIIKLRIFDDNEIKMLPFGRKIIEKLI